LACILSHAVLAVRFVHTSRAVGLPERAGQLGGDGTPVPVAATAAGETSSLGEPERSGSPRAGGTSTIVRTWNRLSWLTLAIVALAYWAIYGQLNAVVPVAAHQMTGSRTAISVVFVINGILVVLCQYALLQRIFRDAESRTLLVVGFLCFAVGYLILSPEAGWWSVLCYVVPVTFAEMLIGPSLDEQAVRAAPRGRTGRALGGISAVSACGSLLGASLGGVLFQALNGSGVVWLIVAGCALAVAAVSATLPRTGTGHAFG
jgi:predicted MFS family arabinose efflux permease